MRRGDATRTAAVTALLAVLACCGNGVQKDPEDPDKIVHEDVSSAADVVPADGASASGEDASQPVDAPAADAATTDPVEEAPPSQDAQADLPDLGLTKSLAPGVEIGDAQMVLSQKGKLGKVAFDHYGHFDNATCWTCHHNEPTDKTPSSCSACHTKPATEKGGMIDRQNAFHGQCKDCHIQAKSGPYAKCIDCHVK